LTNLGLWSPEKLSIKEDQLSFFGKRIQTDNGSEFEKHFRTYVRKNNIVHFNSYPRRPKENAYVERFNRTLKEQYINWHRENLCDTEEFNLAED